MKRLFRNVSGIMPRPLLKPRYCSNGTCASNSSSAGSIKPQTAAGWAPYSRADHNSRVQLAVCGDGPLAHPIADGPSGAEDIPEVPKGHFRIIDDLPKRDCLRNTADPRETPYCFVLLDRKDISADLVDRYQFKVVQHASWRL
jgi:hypothetical protein